MPKMKYAQILLATTLTTQELPESNAPVAGASAEQPAASEAAAESTTPAKPATR